MARYPKALKDATNLQQQAIEAFDFAITNVEETMSEFVHASAFAELFEQQPPAVKQNDKTSGVLLIAMGHPYYGEMAANLAISIRYGDPTIPIHLVWAGEALAHLSAQKIALFTTLQEAPAESYTKNGKKAYFKAKTWMYNFTPYDRTLFLDVDMLWFGDCNMGGFLQGLQGVEFTIQNRDRIDLSTLEAGKKPFYIWADAHEIKQAYGFEAGYLYGLHSEMVYFEKGDKARALFTSARAVYDNPKVTPFVFAGDMADELAFAIAMIQNDIHPHKHPYHPVYWWKLDGRNGTPHKISELAKNYAGYSVGGNVQPQIMVNTYKIMTRAYARAVGVDRIWALKNKRQFITERKKL